MALGKELGAFSLQIASTTWSPGSGTAIKAQANMEGSGTGPLGEVAISLTHSGEIELGAKSGTYSQHGIVTRQDGTWATFHVEGTWEEIGVSKFRYRGTGHTSDGVSAAQEAEGDFTTKTWAGKLYEWN